jgi:uncharacterized protein (DUF697 family)
VNCLEIQNCTHLKIIGREPGDEFPDWQQEFALIQPTEMLIASPEIPVNAECQPLTLATEACIEEMLKTQPSSLELARQGDAQAIMQIMNYLLKSKGLTVITNLKGECLLVTLQADQIPDQEKCVVYVRKVLDELKLNIIRQVKLYGRRKGSSFVAWTQDLNIAQPQQGDFWGAMFGAVTGAVGTVGGAAAYAGGAVVGTVTGAVGTVEGAAAYAGGAVVGTALGVVESVGSTAMQATDGVGYVFDMITNSPQLQEITKALKVDWLMTVIERIDIVKAETHVKNLQRKYPNEKPRDIAHRIMMEKALYVGSSGFASSLMPGFAAAMFAVDLAATMALQAEMVYQIAGAYGLNLQDPARKGEVLAVFGITLGSSSALQAGLGLARNIPVAGSVIGASSNAAMLYALGYATCRFYEAKLTSSSPPSDLQASQVASEKYFQGVFNQQIIMDQILVHLVLAGKPGKTLQQVLPELQTLNLNPASLNSIAIDLRALPSLEKLLEHLSQDFAVSLIAQCQKIAQSDGVITPQEAKVIKMIRAKFSAMAIAG